MNRKGMYRAMRRRDFEIVSRGEGRKEWSLTVTAGQKTASSILDQKRYTLYVKGGGEGGGNKHPRDCNIIGKKKWSVTGSKKGGDRAPRGAALGS